MMISACWFYKRVFSVAHKLISNKLKNEICIIPHHRRCALHHDLHWFVIWISWIASTDWGVEAIDINLLILFEYFINGFTTIIVAPCIINVKITAWFDYFMSLIRYHSMTPSIIHYTSPVLSIRCFRITQLYFEKGISCVLWFPIMVQ